jgi:3-isopropylmalate/(R)-2-methylmalate dehydratase small subunit
LKNGLLPVTVDEDTHRWLVEHPGAEVEIDLPAMCLHLPNGSVAAFPIEAFSRHCLLNGIDELDYLLGQRVAIERYEQAAG